MEINNLGGEDSREGVVELDLEMFLLALEDFYLNLRIIWHRVLEIVELMIWLVSSRPSTSKCIVLEMIWE